MAYGNPHNGDKKKSGSVWDFLFGQGSLKKAEPPKKTAPATPKSTGKLKKQVEEYMRQRKARKDLEKMKKGKNPGYKELSK